MSAKLFIGDTWSYVGKAKLIGIDGSVIPPIGWTLFSAIYDKSGAVVVEFECDWIDVNSGTFYHRLIDTSSIDAGWYRFTITLISPENERISANPQSILMLSLGNY